jgi:hypothetical protein
LAGLLDPLAVEFGSEVTSFAHGSVRLSFRRTPLDVRLPQESPICVIGSRRCWADAYSLSNTTCNSLCINKLPICSILNG